MTPVIFLQIKGVTTVLFGLLFLFVPTGLMALLGAEIGNAGETMIRLFGLPLLVVGYEMAVTPQDAEIDLPATFLTVVCEVIAVFLVASASVAGTFNTLGYVLAAVYLLSGCGFFYCYLSALKQQRESTE